jgi:S-adenosylmethionine decarboxylase
MLMKTKRSFCWIPKIKNKKYAGVHLIAEFWHGKTFKDTQKIKTILWESAKRANNTPLKVAIHKFMPHGMTAVILLAESHIAIHSWPEFNYLAIDIFTCGDQTKPKEALEYLKKEFKPKKIEVREFKRGKL